MVTVKPSVLFEIVRKRSNIRRMIISRMIFKMWWIAVVEASVSFKTRSSISIIVGKPVIVSLMVVTSIIMMVDVIGPVTTITIVSVREVRLIELISRIEARIVPSS